MTVGESSLQTMYGARNKTVYSVHTNILIDCAVLELKMERAFDSKTLMV